MRETLNDGLLENVPDEMLSMLSTFSAIDFFLLDVWANSNAFAARLTAPSVMNLETYAIWIPRHTLEEEVREKGFADTLPEATTFIGYAGWLLYHNAA